MILRFARHTRDLHCIEIFYTKIIGLNKLGSFENHNGYNGIFLGLENTDWHLEFTASEESPKSVFDQDDALVFYVNSDLEYQNFIGKLKSNHIQQEKPRNPYWENNGILFSDPDGYKIIISTKQIALFSDDELTSLILQKNIRTWSEAVNFIKQLPYGRNSNRYDLSLVLKENRGTCSSKHAFLRKIAKLNHIDNVKLILGMYKMNHLNTPKIGNILQDHHLDFIPEAHCYLMINNEMFDVTTQNSDINNLKKYIIQEIEIEPEQVDIFKVEYHQSFIKDWLSNNKIDRSFDEIWDIREKCIRNLHE